MSILEILAFESGDKVESIVTAVAGAVVAILGALTPIIKKMKGKTGKEVVKDINKEEAELVYKIVKEQGEVIKEAVSHCQKKKEDEKQ